ncbi:MAG: hypothetical protein J0H08_04810 [Rhizobiales bacterium]|nr:hypothetical protein [Hyphomicrobiales bacterium]
MRDIVVPAHDISAFVARERRLSLAIAAIVVLLMAAAGGFVWNTMLSLDLAQERIAAAEAAAAAAESDAAAARLGASTAIAQLQDGRARFAEGIGVVNQAKGELLRARSALVSVKDALVKSRNLALIRTVERDAARADVARLEGELVTARNDIAGLAGAVATARLQVLGGLGHALIDDVWLARLRAELAYTDVRLHEVEAVAAALQEHIGLTVALSQHLRPVTEADAASLAGSSDELARLLDRVLDLRARNTRFSSANKPGVGFNSPGFTGYVLGRVARGKSMSGLPETDTPQLGDIIRYQNGLDMFLLETAAGEPFVIGMTPVGIAALAPDFGVPRAGALATGILRQ